MTTIILDLEWNGTFTRKTHGYFNEIIEIGAVKLNDDLEQTDTFHAVIKPVVGQKLTSLVHNLTGIEDEELESGDQFSHAISQLRKWIDDKEAVIMTWSNTDLMVLLENCRYFLNIDIIPFMHYYIDLQEYCQQRMGYGNANQLGLSRACELLQINEDELAAHRALDDSIMSGHVFAKVFEPVSFERTIRKMDKEFYDRLTFKPTIISDITDKNINKSDLYFCCSECNHYLRRIGKWKFRNRAFFAEFLCRRCDIRYMARVQVKMKYDGVETKRRLIVKPVEQEDETESQVESKQIKSTKDEKSKTDKYCVHCIPDKTES